MTAPILRRFDANHLARRGEAQAGRAHPASQVPQETEALMQGPFTYLLERERKTQGFLRQLSR